MRKKVRSCLTETMETQNASAFCVLLTMDPGTCRLCVHPLITVAVGPFFVFVCVCAHVCMYVWSEENNNNFVLLRRINMGNELAYVGVITT